MNVKKEAAKDAFEYAAAAMAYGEGAGIRRRLIMGSVNTKMDRIPGYEKAFEAAMRAQDMTAHARNARRGALKRGVGRSLNKNARALISGKSENMSTTLLVVAAAGYMAHKTGYDKKLYYRAKNKWREFRGQDPVHPVTNI
jgi:hypothetical protein